MEKLIELLNEYEGKPSWYELRGSIWFELDGVPYDDYIITKKFGFIKRLVENDKIEFREDFYLEDQHGGGFGEDENIIMLLSISDTPIDDLISYLK